MSGFRIVSAPYHVSSGFPGRTSHASGPRFSGAFDVFQRKRDLEKEAEKQAEKNAAELESLQKQQANEEARFLAQQKQLEAKSLTLSQRAKLQQRQLEILTEPLLTVEGDTLNGADLLDVLHNMTPGLIKKTADITRAACNRENVGSGWPQDTYGKLTMRFVGVTAGCTGLTAVSSLGAPTSGWFAVSALAGGIGALAFGISSLVFASQIAYDALRPTRWRIASHLTPEQISDFFKKADPVQLEEALNQLRQAALIVRHEIPTRKVYCPGTDETIYPSDGQDFLKLTREGKKLLKYAAKNNLGLIQQRIENLNSQAAAVQQERLSNTLSFATSVPTKELQVSALLKKNDLGLTGFETLQEIDKLLRQRVFFRKTFSKQAFLQWGVKTTASNLLDGLEQVGYLVRWGGREGNPDYRLTPLAKELLTYDSVEALKKAGKITKADEKAMIQAEIDRWRQQHQVNEAWLAQLEETHAQIPPHSSGEDGEAVVTERQNQLKMGRNFARKNRQAIEQAIAELAHSQDLLDLNEVNIQLRELAARPEQVAQEVQDRLGTVLRQNKEEYFTNQALLSPEKQLAQINVEERIQQRLLANASANGVASSEPPVTPENTVAIPAPRTLAISAQPMTQSQQS